MTAANLPELTGSEKQIAWASSIRFAQIPKHEAVRDELIADITATKDGITAEQFDAAIAAIHACHNEIVSRTRASEWIDTRLTGADKMALVAAVRAALAV